MTCQVESYSSPSLTQGGSGELVVPAGAAWYARVKRLFDVLLAAALLVLAAPVLFVLALLVKLTSRGPVIYAQTRLGLCGRRFTIYKFRSMVQDAEQTGPQWAKSRDPRVTPIGHFLRTSHLDELPQLWNILRGDMTFVGPRPERPVFATQLERAIPLYANRLLVRPGVTGLAQVQLPADTDLDSVRRKLVCDLHYIQRESLWLDVRIVLCTALGLVGVPYTLPLKALRVPRWETCELTYRDLAAENAALLQIQPAY